MMGFLMSMLFLIPMSLFLNFWFFQWLMFLYFFMFLIKGSYNLFYSSLSYLFGFDLLSYSLILLSIWICALMIMASGKLHIQKNYSNFFNLMLILLLLSLMVTFLSLNLFEFYLFFEISLIPTLILIIGWGYQPERLEAGIYLLFYTLLMSLPMMIMVFYLNSIFGSLNFMFFNSKLEFNIFMFLFMNTIFFVKIPMYFLHLWLPKAHVEAPVSGSMILAGVMLKLGGYGLCRLMILFSKNLLNFNLFFMSLALMGGMFISFVCLKQSDMKSLIAYSSVSHMSFVLVGVLSLSYLGLYGSLFLMLAHGLCSSGLFCLVNILYERSSSRSIYLNKGLLNLVPNLSLFWFLLLSSNMAAPPSMNLVSEILLINLIVGFYFMNMVMLSFMSLLGGAYSLFLYSYTQHGSLYSGVYSMYTGYNREYLVLLLHWVPLNLLFLKMENFMMWI